MISGLMAVTERPKNKRRTTPNDTSILKRAAVHMLPRARSCFTR